MKHHKLKAARLRPSFDLLIANKDYEGIKRKLTPQMLKFIDYFVMHFNASEAIRQTGSNTKYPNRMGYLYLAHPGIRCLIDHRLESRMKESDIKPEYVLKKIKWALEQAENEKNLTAIFKGCELLARHLGMFVDRQEISGPNGDPIKYEQVKQAANDFTSAISSLIERSGTGPTPFEIESGDKS